MKKKINKPASIILVTGLILIIISYMIDSMFNVGFLLRVNSDTFGVGLALSVAGLIWLVFRFRA